MVIELICEDANIDVVDYSVVAMLSNIEPDSINVEEVYDLIDEDAYLEYIGVKSELERLAEMDADIEEE